MLIEILREYFVDKPMLAAIVVEKNVIKEQYRVWINIKTLPKCLCCQLMFMKHG